MPILEYRTSSRYEYPSPGRRCLTASRILQSQHDQCRCHILLAPSANLYIDPGKVGNGRRLVAAPRTQRKLAPKDINAGSDTGSSHFLSITSGAKRLRRDSTSTCQNEPFNNSQIETRNGNNTTQNTTPYSSATRTQNSGLLLARGSHTPPDLFQAYSALCVVVDFCEQQPPGYLEYKDAVALGKWKERLKARTRAIQHGEGEQR